ncbi:hypothetical protein QBC39DRAFT_353804 [Podospora conica]|nr:hypothetical protein QBC39DRAFT_353804 [Schizothecium conicum]
MGNPSSSKPQSLERIFLSTLGCMVGLGCMVDSVLRPGKGPTGTKTPEGFERRIQTGGGPATSTIFLRVIVFWLGNLTVKTGTGGVMLAGSIFFWSGILKKAAVMLMGSSMLDGGFTESMNGTRSV